MLIEGKFFINGELMDAIVEVEDGVIKNIKKSMVGKSKQLKGITFPGAVDTHVHFREPGDEHKEDFYTGTRAAAYGGTTCILDMPNNKSSICNIKALNEKLDKIKGKANVDFGLYGEITNNIKSEFVNKITALKYYMGNTTGTEGQSSDIGILKSVNKVITVHAESQTCLEKFSRTSKNLAEYESSRPIECEVSALESLPDLSNIHIAHITSERGVEIVNSKEFTTEVTTHHLFLNKNSNIGALGKVNPPLRDRNENKNLWDSLISSKIDFVTSDHAPHTLEEKENFEKAPSGIPGVEERVPLFLFLLKQGMISIERFVEVLMQKPAERFDIRKGKITKGYDADFFAVDMGEVEKIGKTHTKCGWSVYENFFAIYPHTVILRGKKIIDQHEFLDLKNGKYIS